MRPERAATTRLRTVLGELDEQQLHRLGEAIGRLLLTDPESPSWKDERFLDWLAREARARDRREARMSDATFLARGEELMARANARLLRVRRAMSRAPLVTNSGSGGAPVSTAPFIDPGVAAGVGRELLDEPVESWVELPTDLPHGKYLALRIVGESMAPLMHTGDTVLVRLGSGIQRDTVVVARHPDDGYVCKRVSAVSAETVVLSSLQRGRAPITIPRDSRLILGTVMLVWCHHRA